MFNTMKTIRFHIYKLFYLQIVPCSNVRKYRYIDSPYLFKQKIGLANVFRMIKKGALKCL